MREADLKVCALEWVREGSLGGPLPIISSEFSLYGMNVRADLAILSGSEFIGIEIKSEADNLRRLPDQIAGYVRCFDYSVVLASPNHLAGIRELDLGGAHIWSVEDGKPQQIAEGEQSTPHHIDLLRLLTLEERRREERTALKAGDGDQFGPSLASARFARQAFENSFRKRYTETSENFWKKVRGREIRVKDLTLLSRFHAERQRILKTEREQDKFWKQWNIDIQKTFAAA